MFICTVPMYALTLNRGLMVMCILGLVIAGIGLYIGLRDTHGDVSKLPVTVVDGAKIMNVLIVDKKGDHVFDPEMFDPDDLKYIVQVLMPNGRREEFETARQLLDYMGEGMTGRIAHQGRWLSKFEPAIMPPQNDS